MTDQYGKDFPDHRDAELLLKAYELRREPGLRAARHFITVDWWPRSLADVRAILDWGHEHNAMFRQVSSYWELVYGMARHGIVHAEYMADSAGGEGLILLAKVHPWLAEIRETAGARFLQSTEWVATRTTIGQAIFARQRDRVEQMRGARS